MSNPELPPEALEAARIALTRLAKGKECPVCGAKIERKEQSGRDIYLWPCGHRYQDKLKRGQQP